MKKYPIAQVHKLIEPGPIVLVTTSYRGKPNIMTMGFHMMIQHNPPLIGAVIGPWDYSFKAIRSSRECVIAIPALTLSSKVVDIGNCSGEDVNKFEKFRLTAKAAKTVKAPLIDECMANIECKVVDTRMVNRYNLFILECTQAWYDPDKREKRTMHHQGDGSFRADGRTIDLKSRMVKWRELAG